MKRKFKQSIPLIKIISTKRTITSHIQTLNPLNTKETTTYDVGNPGLGLRPAKVQGFQSGPAPGTFSRLRSCIVPVEITEPPKISGGQNHKYDGR